MHSKRSRQSDGADSKVSPVRTSDRLRRRPSNPYGRHFVYYTQSSFYNSNKKKSKNRAAASHIAKFIESKAIKKVKNRTNKVSSFSFIGSYFYRRFLLLAFSIGLVRWKLCIRVCHLGSLGLFRWWLNTGIKSTLGCCLEVLGLMICNVGHFWTSSLCYYCNCYLLFFCEGGALIVWL